MGIAIKKDDPDILKEDSMFEDVLPDFQRFLVSQQLVPQKYVKFYVYWASRFITFCNYRGLLDLEEGLRLFCCYLTEKGNSADWQIKQAQKAVRIYIENFLKKDNPKGQPLAVNLAKNHIAIIEQLRRAVQLKHYSRKTEKSYLGWIKRFFSFL